MVNYIGKTLDDRYEILEVIGVGGMAVVYKAKCHKLGRFVAVKILKDEFAHRDDFRKRFHTESQAIAKLNHANIVAVYDVSQSAETDYIVMELVDGITLKQYMQKKNAALVWREALHFSTQIVKALSHAHANGIIHRDIKPHNIMILRDGSVKVADFGIARLQQSTSESLTKDALGSVHYISPEQAKGSHIDARSDIYSLGVVMYEMLTNRLPYEGDAPIVVAMQHIQSIPLMPRELKSDIPRPLEAITMKAMSPALSKRYENADMMLHDLEEFRKNPDIDFEYDLKNLAESEADEPTKNLSEGGILNKRKSEEEYKIRQRNKTLTMIAGVFSILVFITAMVVLTLHFISNTGTKDPVSESLVVPNLIEQRFSDISSTFTTTYPGLRIEVASVEEYHDRYAVGTIISQEPKPGEYVKEGTVIVVTLSKGKHLFPLDDLSGKEWREAQSLLLDRKLSYALDLVYEYSAEVVKDHVIRTEPEAGANVSEGDYVTLIVSRGPETQEVDMPNLIGMQIADATRKMDEADLTIKQIDVDSNKPIGEVIFQSKPAGEKVETKTEVELRVSNGALIVTETPSPSPTPAPTPPPTQPPTPTPTPTSTPQPLS
ncbi:protein kinase [Clostridia bacterium]|nr:protein kinase [Clostridia bacterium]